MHGERYRWIINLTQRALSCSMLQMSPVANNKFIAHAGGQIRGVRYSNSLDAFENSRQYFRLIECDTVLGSDGVLIAHDGLEKNYGLQLPFSSVSGSEFLGTKYLNELRTTHIGHLANAREFADTQFVLDIKNAGDEFDRCIQYVGSECLGEASRSRFIFQVYDVGDLEAVAKNGFSQVILTLWKNYDDAFAATTRDFIEECIKLQPSMILGISVGYHNFVRAGFEVSNPKIVYLIQTGKQLYTHGFKSEDSVHGLVAQGIGLYTHLPFDF